ncbi:hypothetical protein F5Y16DRAFT_407297 [Xylariaceae sp. FL0255]|nr:hypothetical protein F5Y16DRAFT_407297 [Xylariaceae sp. FL0255]
MAFHQPTRQTVQRVFRPALEEDEPRQFHPTPTQPVEESQTWVLFSPATDAGTTTSYTASTHHSNVTLGRSHVSDVGSLNLRAQSEISGERQYTDSFIDAVDEEDDPELDSLDSHLPEFRSTAEDIYTPSHHGLPHVTPVVPAHDGLGSFRIDQEGMGIDVQNRLYAFEQYNPHRIKRRRESLDRIEAEMENDEEAQELDKMRRIESWRLEQSRYLLEEIQKETRRRRRSIASVSKTRSVEKTIENTPLAASGFQGDAEEEWHDQSPGDTVDERESIWGRLTRKVIQDLLGIDDHMLSILFGEALPDEEDLSATPKASAPSTFREQVELTTEGSGDSNWQIRMLERIAKELGSLVHHLSEHPGAFSTFTKVQQAPLPYAGLPVIPESINDRAPKATPLETTSTAPEFQPTIPTATRPIDVPRARRGSESAHIRPSQTEIGGAVFTQEEWEQDLDIRLVFRYLRSKFISRSSGSSSISGASHLTTTNPQDVAAKVARVRQHHPLVARSRTMERRKSKATTASNPAIYRPASSCASQSTRRSVRRSSASSSRHYWDIGGSVGTGSMVATTGPMGSWGEV